ncbi:MAG: AsmA family protein [Burkholderiaceae bacterium]|nr:AsmA family protein [Burkholderiaceae bacterium]
MLKKILIGIGVLVALLVVAVAVLISTFDANRYKTNIEQAAHDKLGRTLMFDGPLSLSVFPTIALALPHTTLSERGSNGQFVSLDRARVSLALLPLLSGRAEVGTVSLYGLRATIERRGDGTTNVDDLTGGAGAKTAPQPSQPGGPTVVGQFEVGGIDIVDAQVTYRDESAHNTITVSKLNLKTGKLATRSTTAVDFSAQVATTQPPASVELSLKTVADVDLERRAFGARDLDARARGRSGADQFDVTLTAPKIALDPSHASGELLKLVAKLTGEHAAHAELALHNLAGTSDALSADTVSVDLDAAQGPQKVVAHLAGPLKFAVAAQKVELPKLAGDVNLESPTLPQKSLKVNVDGSASVDAHAQQISAQLRERFDDTNATTRVDVHEFTKPHIGFDIDVDRLNLDRYLPAAPATPVPPSSGGASPAAAPPAPKSAAPDPKVDLSALKPLNLTGEVRVGALQVHGLKVAKARVGVRAAGGRLDVAPLTANLYEGTLNGNSRIEADGNRIAANLALDGISIGPLLHDLSGKELVDGHGGVKMNVTTAGATVGAMRRSLGGTASLALRDGAVHGINIAQQLRQFESMLSGASSQAQVASSVEKTDFSELTGSFTIRDGVATNKDLQAKSPLLRLSGNGTIDIGAGSLDYTVQASVVGTLSGQGGGELADLRGVTVPVHLSGPFSALSYRLDWGSIARQAVRNKATQQVQNLLGGKTAPGGTPNLGDALKGLLKK